MADNKQKPESDLIPESAPQSPEPAASECDDDQDDQDIEPEGAAMLKFIDLQFNLKMKELFAQPASGQLVPHTIVGTLQETSNYMLQHLGRSHTLAWLSTFKTTSEVDELSFWLDQMKNDVDVLVTQFQQQMYTGLSKMMGATSTLYYSSAPYTLNEVPKEFREEEQ